MPEMPKRALWADIVDDSGDELMVEDSRICKKEDGEKILDGDASPAASCCSTQFSFDDELTHYPSAAPQISEAQVNLPPLQWTVTNMPAAMFVVCPVAFAACDGLPNIPAQAEHVSPVKHVRTDPIKKRFLKQASRDHKGSFVSRRNATNAASQLLPEASEEDWQRRLRKRNSIVAAVKETPEYSAFSAQRRDSRRAALRTPSPDDRSVSKRQWEEKIQKWRTALRKCHSSESR